MIQPFKVYRTYKRLNRYREVIFIFIKYGFDDIVDRISPEILARKPFLRKKRVKTDQPTAARIRSALTELGPTFVKFGQLLSTRSDILPEEYIKELEKLQDEVPPFPSDALDEIFDDGLEKPPGELFSEFDDKPVKSGSIAQVHRAILKSGEKVAVKIQRPGIKSIIETDLSILQELASLIERQIPEARWFYPVELVEQFARTIRRELDFVAEAHAIERFRVNFADYDTFYVPRVYKQFTSEKILTLEFIDGVKITDFKGIEAKGYDKKEIARRGARAILKEVFEDRIFHGDPHPGNFFVLPDNVVAAVDFGIIGRLDEDTAEHLSMLLSALVNRDVDKVIRTFKLMDILTEEVEIPLLKYDLMEFIDRYYGLPLEKLEGEKIVNDLLRIIRRHRIALPMNLALMGRMLMVSAGVGRMLDPGFDMVAEAKPFIESFMFRRFEPKRQLREIADIFEQYRYVVKNIPADFEDIVQKLKKGKMLVSLHHEGLDKFTLEMDRSSNRIAFGLVIASLIIGSSIIIQVDKGPMLFGFSVFGILGYIIAGVLGLWLVIAILRSGRI